VPPRTRRTTRPAEQDRRPLKIEWLPPKDLVPFPGNYRQGDQGAIRASLERWGWYAPLVVQESTGRICVGNNRFKAGLDRGDALFPVVRRDLSDAEAEALLVTDNRTSDLALNDEQALAALLVQIAERNPQDLEGTGWDGDDVDDLLETVAAAAANGGIAAGGTSADEQDAPEPPAEPDTEPGRVYELGRHRLVCGDAFDPDVRALLTAELEVGAVITDPPYGMHLDTDYAVTIGRRRKPGFRAARPQTYRPVVGDDRPFDASPLIAALDHVPEQWWCGADYYRPTLDPDPTAGSWLVWDKRNAETDDVFGSGFELIWSRKRHQRRVLRHFQVGAVGADGRREHPTQKPARLFAEILERWTPNGTVVLDLFAGVGPALLAAEHTGRTALLLEIDPAYCDVIRTRYAREVGDPTHAPATLEA
jgi:site-specific DNA-methyltransferase (adenine-specific)